MENNLVDCRSCSHWDYEFKLKYICKKCNNTGKIKDPKQYLCNLCGEYLCPINDEQFPYGLFEAKVMGGYYSDHLIDLSTYMFSFCEKCLRDLFIKCKIKPKIYDSDFEGNFREEISWESDQKTYEFEIWQKDGGKERAFTKGKCNFAKDCEHNAIYSLILSGDLTKDISCEEHKDLYINCMNAKLISFERKE